MKSYYVKGLLPEWVIVHEEIEDFELEPTFQFQLKWEQTFLKMWQDLIDSERDQITPITPPYTEEMVTGFLDLLKRTRQNRGFFGRVVSALPDFTPDKELPLSISTQAKDIIDQLRSRTHPVFWSSMTVIEPGVLQRGGVSVQLTRRFIMGQFQVTQQLWEAVMGNRPSYFKDGACPVEQVNWLDCVVFCNRLSEMDGLEPVYRLPEGTVEALHKQR